MDPSAPDLPADLRAFLYACIDSIPQIELLMRLRRLGRSMTVRALSAETGLAPAATRHHLETLAARGLLRAEAGAEVQYAYDPKSPELRRFGELAAEYYGSNRDIVIRFIAARAARTFAGAFKLRKEP